MMRTVQDTRLRDTSFNRTPHENTECMHGDINQTQLVGFDEFGHCSKRDLASGCGNLMGFTRRESRTRLIMHLVDNARETW